MKAATKHHVCIATTETILSVIDRLRGAGFRVDFDPDDAGTLEAFDGDTRIYWALKKGAADVWIVRAHPDYFTRGN